MSGIEVRIDSKRFGIGRPVLTDCRLRIATGEIAAVLGPSGAGKTTLLGMLAGLDHDFHGEILRDGLPLSTARPRLGVVFQEPRLLPWLTVRQNVALVLADARSDAAWIDRLLRAVSLADRADALPGELSGGMQRRVALARAFAVRPELLLLDEPFVSLDAPTAQQLRAFLRELWADLRPTAVLVSHDIEDAVALADRIFFLSDAPARVVLEQPLPALNGGAAIARRREVVNRVLASHPHLLAGELGMPAAEARHRL
jgi:ABC-type nitrate/sulfonate/bicarbonate transport system ATPase subunit